MTILLYMAAMALGYAFGAIPTALILLRVVEKKDIRKHGTGNIGARNVYDVSGKYWLGILVAVLDMAKGAAPVWLCYLISPNDFTIPALAAFFAVTGHNYNVFLQMRGGRGLATACGAVTAINPIPLICFGLMWLTGYFVIKRNVHVANVAGILGASVLIMSVPDLLLETFMFIPAQHLSQLKILAIAIVIQIFLRHLEPIRALIARSDDDA